MLIIVIFFFSLTLSKFFDALIARIVKKIHIKDIEERKKETKREEEEKL